MTMGHDHGQQQRSQRGIVHCAYYVTLKKQIHNGQLYKCATNMRCHLRLFYSLSLIIANLIKLALNMRLLNILKYNRERYGDKKKTDNLDDFEKDAIMTNGNNVAKKESAVVLDDTTVIAQCVLFFAAGADTIENALTFSAYDLALNTEIQEKVAAEVTKAIDENDGNLTYDMIHQLEYLDKFLSESMRIHPIGFLAERTTTQDYTIPDTTVVIPKGTRVQIPIGSIQSDPKYYPDPMTFNPENFSAENKAKRHPYAYMPFGNGPRNCIAMRFAITEAKAAIAHLVYNFRVEPCEKTQIPLKVNKRTFKPEKGMWLKFAPRR